jgi:hypothetical protein
MDIVGLSLVAIWRGLTEFIEDAESKSRPRLGEVSTYSRVSTFLCDGSSS